MEVLGVVVVEEDEVEESERRILIVQFADANAEEGLDGDMSDFTAPRPLRRPRNIILILKILIIVFLIVLATINMKLSKNNIENGATVEEQILHIRAQ